MSEVQLYEPEFEDDQEVEDDGNTTTVQFIAVSAEEHERMVREGNLTNLKIHEGSNGKN